MRRSSAIVLLLTALTTPSVFGCSEATTDDATASDEDEVTSRNNPMGLRLAYDEATGTVRATVKRRLRAGEELRLLLRRGRISSDAQREIACLELPPAPPIDGVRERGKAVYQGPHIDPILLASVYDEAWVRAHLTPEQLDVLSRESGDAIVEACIVDGDRTFATLRTALAHAWNVTDPNVADGGIDVPTDGN